MAKKKPSEKKTQPIDDLIAWGQQVRDEAAGTKTATKRQRERLEYLRGELRAERISLDEIHELQSLAAFIDPDDVELLEAAGVPEGNDAAEPWHDHLAELDHLRESLHLIDVAFRLAEKSTPANLRRAILAARVGRESGSPGNVNAGRTMRLWYIIQAGSSAEVYLHTFDSLADAEAHKKSCEDAAYSCHGPETLDIDLPDPCIVAFVEGGVLTDVVTAAGWGYDVVDWDNAKSGDRIELSAKGRSVLAEDVLSEIDEHNAAHDAEVDPETS